MGRDLLNDHGKDGLELQIKLGITYSLVGEEEEYSHNVEEDEYTIVPCFSCS